MARLDHYSRSNSTNRVHDLLRDLLGEPLLELQPSRIHVDHAGQLGNSEHLSARNVTDVATAEERQDVVLAQAIDLDVLHNHHAVRLLGEDGTVDQLVDVGAIPGRKVGVRGGN